MRAPAPPGAARAALAALTALAALAALAACAEGAPDDDAPLSARALSPAAAAPGDVVSVYGHGFGVEGTEDGVWLSGAPLEVRYWSDARVDVRLSPAQPLGSWLLVVRANGAAAPPLTLEVRAP